MNPRTTLVLTVVAVIGTLLAWNDARHSEFSYQKDLGQPFRFPDTSVVSIEITRPGLSLSLARDDGVWRIESPIEYPASQASAEIIVRLVRELRVQGEGGDLRTAGIGDESTRLRLGVEGRADVEITTGSDHPTLPYSYIAMGDRVVLIDPTLVKALNVITVADLREDALCDIPVSRADRLTVERDGETISILRHDDVWVLESPVTGDADAAAANRAINGLNAWAVHSFVADAMESEESLVQFGLSPPKARIEVRERGTGRTVRLRVGARTELPSGGGDGIYIFVENTRSVVRATSAMLTRLPGTETLRSRLLVRAPQPDIVVLRVTGDYGRVELRRDDDGVWTMLWSGDNDPHPVIGSFETMLESVRGGSVEKFISFDDGNIQRYGFDRPTLRMELVRANAEVEQLMVGDIAPDEAGARFIRNPRWSEVAIAHVPNLQLWQRAPFTLRSDEAVSMPRDQIRRIRIRAAGGETEMFVRPHQDWRAAGDASPTLSPEVRLALDSLPLLLAEPWEPFAPDPPGPLTSSLAIDLLPAGDETAEPGLRLWMGPHLVDGRLVRLGDEGWVLRTRSTPDPFTALEERLLQRP